MKPIILSSNLIKQGLFILLFISTTPTLHAQSWVWGKSGGGFDELSTNALQRQEEVYSIVTDSQGNSYVLSAVSKTGLSIDGHPKSNFADPTTITDYVVASFACDGNYRWSKVFGGGYETIHPLQIDAQDNVYVAGRFAGCGSTLAAYPPRIDSDLIISQNPQDCRLIFLCKINSIGDMQWIRRPQSIDVSITVGSGQTRSRGIAVDAVGMSYWLVGLPQGTYADGAFTNTLTNANYNVSATYFILKYDTTGAFVSATPLNIQSTGIGDDMQFYRNAHNGNFYLFTTNLGNNSATFTIDGQTVTNSMLLACLNPQGQLLWLRQNTTSHWGYIFVHNLAFDAQDNIYVSGQIQTPFNAAMDSFLGVIGNGFAPSGYVAKLNPTADTLLWSIYNNNLGARFGAITVNNNEVAVTSTCGENYAWGNFSVHVNNMGQGGQAMLARFNKDTGQCLSIAHLPNDNVGNIDYGTAIAADAAGDYLLGGGFAHFLYFDNNVSVLNSAAQTDFFLAKYAAHACTLGTPSLSSATAVLYPNPANNQLWIYGFDTARYQIYGLSGSLLLEGTYNGQQPIDSSALANGCYLLQIVHNDGQKSTHKLLIQH
ncbi:MAG: hypothetical protein CFE24_11445 [Flavobacterium sp. BFFFF2]|nr:MAG: hypothetical protein CFE24_11445 [Flavobacterium sp. BFFFF2]